MRFLKAIAFLAVAGWAFPQCVSEKAETLLITDFYRDAVQVGDQLILANAHGLVFKDLEALSPANRQVLAIPGDIVQLFYQEGRLYAVAEDLGVHVYVVDDPDQIPREVEFLEIPGIRAAFKTAGALFSLTKTGVGFHNTELSGEAGQTDFFSMADAEKIIASEAMLLTRRRDGALFAVDYDEEGFQGQARRLNIDGSTLFLDMHLADDLLVLDALDGVKWLQFDDNGQVLDEGAYYDNRSQKELVFASLQSGSNLFLRFADRLDIFNITPSRALARTDSIALPFSDLGVTKMIPGDNGLHLLNVAGDDREWSLASYRIGAGRLLLRARLEANFQELSGAASVDGNLFIAFGPDLRYVQDAANLKLVRSLPVSWQFVGPVVAMAGSDRHLFVAVNLPDTGYTRFHVFQVAEGGALEQVYSRDFQGGVRQLSQNGDRAALGLYYRSTTADHYQAQVVFQTEQGAFQARSIGQTLPLQSGEPYRDLQIAKGGLVYHDGARIYLHPNLDNLSQRMAMSLPDEEPIDTLAAAHERLWVEAASGLWLTSPSEDGALQVQGLYRAWHGLSRLSNNLIAARNRHDRAPSRYVLLGLSEERDLVHGQVAFSTASEPFYIAQFDELVFVAEKTSISAYRHQCPAMNYEYLIPISPNLELELNSAMGEGDTASMIVFNRDNQVIGMQRMTAELVDAFNGSPPSDWLFDFNALEEPYSFILLASRAMAPVVSGVLGESPTSRFAYLVPEGSASALYVPHLPRDTDVWRTDVYVRSFDAADAGAMLELSDARGSEMVSGPATAPTEIIPIDQSIFANPTPWAVVFSDGLNTSLSGFSVFQALPLGQAAAVPLVSQHSDYMIVPRLAASDDPNGWTGIVLANPHAQPVDVRLIGYDLNGDIAVDETLSVNGSDSFITLAEGWLGQFTEASRVRWMAVIAERPIMGIILYGNLATGQMAGLPMLSDSGQTLLFSGIRSNPDWWTSLALTNSELTPTDVVIEAIDGSGQVAAVANATLSAKGSAILPVDELFAELSGPSRARIGAIRVRSQTWICGYAMRGQRNAPTLEAYSAFAE